MVVSNVPDGFVVVQNSYWFGVAPQHICPAMQTPHRQSPIIEELLKTPQVLNMAYSFPDDTTNSGKNFSYFFFGFSEV